MPVKNLDITVQNEIKEVIDGIDWSELGSDVSGWKDIDYDKQWKRIKNKLRSF